MLTEKILLGIGEFAEQTKIKANGKYVAGWALFKNISNVDVIKKVEGIIDEFSKSGEKIKCDISKGKVYDMDSLSLEIEGGTIIEFYNYSETSSIFIRLYRLRSGANVWLSLYLDENPETPWWSNIERAK